ncbi:uncharacterized protein LACBIDRAFT_293269 [Laccaria bicolor S238N-H82]|uniref:Predicted protein n=1 Tax=Laccaria bicolor (strain S238N-H82 / ATCC MYA-4686) TaxID=486041 RepID=B0D2K5_LACBS|nr:uncharacterized protein LACBIDRAFT_293269 [Laccaria bicolor S238N-H82]EDR10767.1 predicted protein [Laccaria bicolor S238N-H82]|eukprot:XP_001878068.1 predicted protein [Laccaria bicolor S238N-H82]
MQASPPQAPQSHARTSSTGSQNSSSLSTETPPSSAPTSTPLAGCDTDTTTHPSLPRLREAIGPEGLEIREHPCSIFTEYSYGKDIWDVVRPVIYVVPQIVFRSVKPEQEFDLVLAHLSQLQAEENLRWLPLDAAPDDELDVQEMLVESIIARAEAELRISKPLGGGGNWQLTVWP